MHVTSADSTARPDRPFTPKSDQFAVSKPARVPRWWCAHCVWHTCCFDSLSVQSNSNGNSACVFQLFLCIYILEWLLPKSFCHCQFILQF